MLTQSEALAQGYTVDANARIAYRGPRVNPTAVVPVFTQYETELRAALQAIVDGAADPQDIARNALHRPAPL